MSDPRYEAIVNLGEGKTSQLDAQIKRYIKEPLPAFKRMIVLDVISDPFIIDDNKIDYWKNVLKVTNSRFAKILPRNSIVAQPAYSGGTKISPVMFLFPFFPSHLGLPCKPGEMVWTMFENPNASIKEIGYWFCRITEPHITDDVNHTHHASQLDHEISPSIKKQMEGGTTFSYELRNGKTQTTKDGVKSVLSNSKLLQVQDEEIFEKLITQSDAAGLMHYESIPRFKKRPGDVTLEGSNNTLINLGTDRNSMIGDYQIESSHPNRGITPEIKKDFRGNAGSIDIVAGRGTTPITSGVTATTRKIADGQELKKEISKSNLDLTPGEGDPDFINDRSRILVSQRTLPDTNFAIKDYLINKFTEGTIAEDGTNGDAAVVIKSDKVRIIARSDISFIVTNYNKISQDNVEYKLDESDKTKWASITIKRNGDIVFTPSSEGVIKLGGDDATQAILCTAYRANNNAGTVKATPIASTSGGFVGTYGNNVDTEAANLKKVPDLGTFSTKVLIK